MGLVNLGCAKVALLIKGMTHEDIAELLFEKDESGTRTPLLVPDLMDACLRFAFFSDSARDLSRALEFPIHEKNFTPTLEWTRFEGETWQDESHAPTTISDEGKTAEKTGGGWSTARADWFSTSSGTRTPQKLAGTVKLLTKGDSWKIGVILRGYKHALMSYDAKAWSLSTDCRNRGAVTHGLEPVGGSDNTETLPGYCSGPSQGDEVTVEVEDNVLTLKLNGKELRRRLHGPDRGKTQAKVRLPEDGWCSRVTSAARPACPNAKETDDGTVKCSVCGDDWTWDVALAVCMVGTKVSLVTKKGCYVEENTMSCKAVAEELVRKRMEDPQLTHEDMYGEEHRWARKSDNTEQKLDEFQPSPEPSEKRRLATGGARTPPVLAALMTEIEEAKRR